MKKSKPILTVDEALEKYATQAKTIEELFCGDEAKIRSVCRQLRCDRKELLITADDLKKLAKHSPLSKKDRKNVVNAIDDACDSVNS